MCKPVFNLKKKVDSEIEFYLEQEKKLIERYSAKDENGHPKFLAGGRIELMIWTVRLHSRKKLQISETWILMESM